MGLQLLQPSSINTPLRWTNNFKRNINWQNDKIIRYNNIKNIMWSEKSELQETAHFCFQLFFSKVGIRRIIMS